MAAEIHRSRHALLTERTPGRLRDRFSRPISGAAGAVSLRLFVYGATDNDAETIYVALEDASGNIATVTHPTPAVTQTEARQKWQIPLSSFSGVNLATVETMYIGVGDRDNPSSGGTGRIFIDDIGFGTSALYTLGQGDVTSPGDTVQGLPVAETLEMAVDNETAYTHYRILFSPVRDPASANSMQIAEIELIETIAP